MAYTAQPGINATLTINNEDYPATASMEANKEVARVDVTGFGDTSRTYVSGLEEPLIATVTFYADPAGTLIAAGDSYADTTLAFGGSGAPSFTGTATITGMSYTAEVDGALEVTATLEM